MRKFIKTLIIACLAVYVCYMHLAVKANREAVRLAEGQVERLIIDNQRLRGY